MKKQFCVHGHDTFVVGRDKYYACRQCKAERQRRFQQSEVGAAWRRRRYQKDREREIERALIWNRAHRERHRINDRKHKRKMRSVAFWVEAASKSR